MANFFMASLPKEIQNPTLLSHRTAMHATRARVFFPRSRGKWIAPQARDEGGLSAERVTHAGLISAPADQGEAGNAPRADDWLCRLPDGTWCDCRKWTTAPCPSNPRPDHRSAHRRFSQRSPSDKAL